MRPYEAMVVLRPNLEQDALDAVINRLTDVITDQGGQITHVDPWGKRRLAYEIDGHTEGYYVVIKFQGQPGITTELERIMRITDAVMRFLVVRDEFPTAVPKSAAAAPESVKAEEKPAEEPSEGDEGAGDAAETEAAEEAGAEAEAAAETDAPAEAEAGADAEEEAKASAEADDDADEAAGKQES